MQTAVTVLFDHDPRDGAGLPELVTTLVNDAKRMGLTCAEEYVGEKWWEDEAPDSEVVEDVAEFAPDEAEAEPEQAAVLTVTFASAAAAKLADDANLTDADFDGVEPSGAGGYVKSDVQAIIGAQG